MLFKKFCLIFVLIIFALNTHASKLIISGNKRTKNSYIKDMFNSCVQKGQVENRELEQCLLNSKLFVKVKVSKQKDTTSIEVEDRWTLLPIPFVSSNRKENKYGLFLFERNLLGFGKLLVMGGSLGSQSSSFFTLYKDPYLFSSTFTLELKLRINENDFYLYEGKKKVDGYEANIKRFSFELGKRFKEWNFYGGLGFLKDKFENILETFHPKDNSALATIVGFEFDSSKFKFYFNQGLKTEFQYTHEIYQNNKGVLSKKLWGNISWQINPVSDHALQIQSFVSYLLSGGDEDILTIGGIRGFRGVAEGGIWSKRSISLSLDYQVPVAKLNYGTWTLAPFTEYGHSKRYLLKSSSKDSYSFGIGSYLFLKQVAMPGLGVVIGRNPNFEENFVSAFIGKSI